MGMKSPATAYYSRKLKITSRSKLTADLDDAPLTKREREFIRDIVEGMTLQELADKHSLSTSRISKWKREIFERLQAYDLSCARR